jgi:hypothetical protein
MLFPAHVLMTRISGWIFMAIGATVTLFSNYVRKRGGEGLALFFWVGIVMIGIGVFKIAVGFVTKEQKTKDETYVKEEKNKSILHKFGFNKDLDVVGAKELEREKQNAVNNIQSTNILVCPVCGTKHYSNSNFCHMCGTRLK